MKDKYCKLCKVSGHTSADHGSGGHALNPQNTFDGQKIKGNLLGF